MYIKKKLIIISEPIFFAWLIASASILFIVSGVFRNEVRDIFNRTGRSKIVYLRCFSKRNVKEFPYLIPLFVFLPLIVGYFISGFTLSLTLGIYGFLILALIPVTFPVPSNI